MEGIVAPCFSPGTPDWAERVTARFARQGLMATLGAWIEPRAPGQVAVHLPHDPKVLQQHQLFHGGAIGAIADVAAGFSSLSLMPPDSAVLTVEYKINFMRPAIGRQLIAEGRVIRPGRTVTVAEAEVFAEAEDGTRQPVALMLTTMMRVAPLQGHKD